MSNPRSFSAISAVSAIDPDTRRQWVELLPAHDKAKNGPFYTTVTTDDLEVYAQSIRDIGSGALSFDRDHDGAVGGSTKAAGWLTGDARVADDPERGPILEVEVEWTPTAAKEIEDGDFRFVSSEYRLATKDPKTGLMSGAKPWESGDVVGTLTNRPFFAKLAALASDGTVVWAPEQGVNYVMGLVSAALNDAAPDEYRYWLCDIDIPNGLALVSEADATWVVSFARDGDTVTLAPQSGWEKAKQEWVSAASAATAAIDELRKLHVQNGGVPASTEGDSMSDELKALAADLGLPEDATAEDTIVPAKTAIDEKTTKIGELEAELETLKAEAAKAPQSNDRVVTVDKEAFEQLQQKAEVGVTARAEQVKKQADDLVAAAALDGRIAPASSTSWRAAILPPDATELVTTEVTALASLAKGRIPVGERGHNGDEQTTSLATQLDTVRAGLGLKTRSN